MTSLCPDLNCPGSIIPSSRGPKSNPVVRDGRFYRRSDKTWIPRFRCKKCYKRFSAATADPCVHQKKRHLNPHILFLLCSANTQRRLALYLKVNPKTIARKLTFIAVQARLRQEEWLKTIPPVHSVQFDDLETSEHSKCKPLSIALAVDAQNRKILSFQVSQMPAKGLLARAAFRKYGIRRDRRGRGWDRLMRDLRPIVKEDAVITSDENPHYPKHVRRHFPEAVHKRVKGRRACVAGQGELKKGGFDPLFSLNHTCAMLRANLSRLVRRTWSTTKKRERLADHIAIYVEFHNQFLTNATPQ